MAIVPTIVVAAFFYVIITRMIEGDRRERLAQSKFEADEDRRRSAADAGAGAAGNAPADDITETPGDAGATDGNRP
ncbi:hypothetical protein G7075_17040 [Phycicoccus sp. HDW14]|uniref:hypothetical protein n=1 Tax=Phycicoccus sp. HDW14 TaxID=2714941 RepID=UPI00140A3EFC|nr:hypothetical protein [Phycicoccus sp. HDW14]QIM19878.1 hypothetical protein G7075_17040 [Phycicoccus sp. HDW14]